MRFMHKSFFKSCNAWASKSDATLQEKVLHVLKREVPEFEWTVDTLDAQDYLLAQRRVRVFLRGTRKSIMSMPPCLPPFGKLKLRDALNSEFPNVNENHLTPSMRANLQTYQDARASASVPLLVHVMWHASCAHTRISTDTCAALLLFCSMSCSCAPVCLAKSKLTVGPLHGRVRRRPCVSSWRKVRSLRGAWHAFRWTVLQARSTNRQ